MPLDFFGKNFLPDELPLAMEETVKELKKSQDKEEYLKKVYDLLSEKYHGERIKTYLKLFEIFKNDLEFLWNRSGFLHCTNINYLAKILLIKSGFFLEEDIELKWTLVWFISPHQYLRVKVSENDFVNVDIWAKNCGIKFGDYARGFNNFLSK